MQWLTMIIASLSRTRWLVNQSVLLFNLSFSRMYAHFSIESFEPNESRRDNVSVPWSNKQSGKKYNSHAIFYPLSRNNKTRWKILSKYASLKAMTRTGVKKFTL